MKKRIKEKIAKEDKLILIRPVSNSVKIHKTTRYIIEGAKFIALTDFLKNGGTRKQINNKIKTLRYLKHIQKTKKKYPEIYNNIHKKSNLAAVGRKYKLTRERIRQIKNIFEEYNRLKNIAFENESEIIDMIVKELSY